MAEKSIVFTATPDFDALIGSQRTIELKEFTTSSTATLDNAEKINRISFSHNHFAKPGGEYLFGKYYFKTAFYDGNEKFVFMASSKTSMDCSSAPSASRKITEYFKGVSTSGDEKWEFLDSNNSFSMTLPTVDDFKTLMSNGYLYLYANGYGHNYLGDLTTGNSSYGLGTNNDTDSFVLTVYYEEKETSTPAPNPNVTNVTFSSNSSGKLIYEYTLSWNSDYILTNNDKIEETISDSAGKSQTTTREGISGIEAERSFLTDLDYSADEKYTLQLNITMGGKLASFSFSYSESAPASPNFDLAGSGKGVAIGKEAVGTSDSPLFECVYPARFENGIEVNGIAFPKIVYGKTSQITIDAGTSVDFTINCSSIFSNEPYVVATPQRTSGAEANGIFFVIKTISKDATSGEWECVISAFNTQSTAGRGISFYWIAIGQ